MKIVIAPDSYKESLSALEVATAIERGFREIFPEAVYVKLPVADGGEGTVEAMIGFWRYILLYLLCGAGGMLIAWTASQLSTDPHPIILLGASASVLGLVGTQAAISLLAYRYTGSMVAKAQLNTMIQIVVLQAVFDMMVPQVSSTAHTGGAAVGFCVTYGVVQRKLRRARREGDRPRSPEFSES
jgi:glycerate kinase